MKCDIKEQRNVTQWVIHLNKMKNDEEFVAYQFKNEFKVQIASLAPIYSLNVRSGMQGKHATK